MTKVILHIGMPKCASSSLQAHFWTNYAAYRQQGLLYPRTACEATGYRSHRPLHNAPLAQIPALVDAIAQEAEQAGCDRILLSSEELLNSRWDRPESAAVVAALHARFGRDNVRLLFIVRDHVSFVCSAFAQFIRGGLFRVREKDVFRHAPLGIRSYADAFQARYGFEVFSYSDFLCRFAGGAGGTSFDVLSLHRSDGGGGDILEKTCRLLGVKLAPQGQETNMRLTEQQLFCLLHARKRYGFARVKERRSFLTRCVAKAPKFTSPVFRPDLMLFERLQAAAAVDRAFFTAGYEGPFDGAFGLSSAPDLNQEGRRAPGRKMVRFIDAVMTPETMTLREARQIRNQIFGPTSDEVR